MESSRGEGVEGMCRRRLTEQEAVEGCGKVVVVLFRQKMFPEMKDHGRLVFWRCRDPNCDFECMEQAVSSDIPLYGAEFSVEEICLWYYTHIKKGPPCAFCKAKGKTGTWAEAQHLRASLAVRHHSADGRHTRWNHRKACQCIR